MYICKLTIPLLQVMACSQFGAKPLSEPAMGYCYFDHCAQASTNFEKMQQCSLTKMALKMSSVKDGGHFVSASLN